MFATMVVTTVQRACKAAMVEIMLVVLGVAAMGKGVLPHVVVCVCAPGHWCRGGCPRVVEVAGEGARGYEAP